MWDKCSGLSRDICPQMQREKQTWGQMPLSVNLDVSTEISVENEHYLE